MYVFIVLSMYCVRARHCNACKEMCVVVLCAALRETRHTMHRMNWKRIWILPERETTQMRHNLKCHPFFDLMRFTLYALRLTIYSYTHSAYIYTIHAHAQSILFLSIAALIYVKMALLSCPFHSFQWNVGYWWWLLVAAGGAVAAVIVDAYICSSQTLATGMHVCGNTGPVWSSSANRIYGMRYKILQSLLFDILIKIWMKIFRSKLRSSKRHQQKQ